MSTQRYLNTKLASVYLESLGVGYTPKSLEVLRCYGRGPAYRKVGHRVFYVREDLDSFAAGVPVMTIDSHEEVRRHA
jgi:hypothetical protein